MRIPQRALLAATFVASGCVVDRDNPFDPDGTVRPFVEIRQPYAITCAQWQNDIPDPQGFEQEAIGAEEAAELDLHCDTCGGIPECHGRLMLTSQTVEPAARCEEGGGSQVSLSYLEVLYSADAAQAANILLPGDAQHILLDTFEQGGLQQIAGYEDPDSFSLAWASAHFGEDHAWASTAAFEAYRDHRLLTRTLASVDRHALAVTFEAGFGANVTPCRVDIRFDEATVVVDHPFDFGGGYGRHVALANLALDGTTTTGVSELEAATTFALGDGSCWIDVIHRDAGGQLVRANEDYTDADFVALCHEDGEPPPLAAGRFFDGGGEGFAVLSIYFGTQYLDFIGQVPGDDPFDIGAPEYFVFEEFLGAPRDIAGVGDLIGTSADDVALIAPDGSSLSLCTTTGTCVGIDPPDCQGSAASFVDVAAWPGAVELEEMLVATQSSSGTCVLWLNPGAPFTVTREETFPGVAPVHLQWATLGGVPSAILNGWVSEDPTVVAVEMPALPSEPDTYQLIYDQTSCMPLVGGTDGAGSSSGTEFTLECAIDGSGCDLYSFRSIGLPGLDVDLEEGVTVVDEGSLAYWQYGCADPANAYYLIGLPFFGSVHPTSIATSMAARLDFPRARIRDQDAASCQVPSTYVLGAPADGPLGGVGQMILVYASGDTYRTQPFCTPVIP